jgi:hypothetical protein
MKQASMISACLLFAVQTLAQSVPPVIDMHMHALGYTEQGPPLSDEEIARKHANGATQ